MPAEPASRSDAALDGPLYEEVPEDQSFAEMFEAHAKTGGRQPTASCRGWARG